MKNRRKNVCRDRIFSCRNTDYYNLEKPIEIERMHTITIRQSISRNCMKKFCHDKVMNMVTLKDKVSYPDREIKS